MKRQSGGSSSYDDAFALEDVFDVVEISKDDKRYHFERIREATGLAFEDMVFFDNEYGNCRDISSMGVTVGYCPEGVTSDVYQAAMAAFPAPAGAIVGADKYGVW